MENIIQVKEKKIQKRKEKKEIKTKFVFDDENQFF